jgi:hypothetical protein
MLFTIGQFAVKGSFQAIDDMAFLAPVVGKIIRGVFHYPYPEPGELQGFPPGGSGIALMFRLGDLSPVDCLKRDMTHARCVLK